jgi:hypothetical protein
VFFLSYILLCGFLMFEWKGFVRISLIHKEFNFYLALANIVRNFAFPS